MGKWVSTGETCPFVLSEVYMTTNKKTKKYYAVKQQYKNYQGMIFNNWHDCQLFVNGKNVRFKSFETVSEALTFLDCLEHQVRFMNEKPTLSKEPKFCLICGKPVKIKGQCCPVCNKRRRALMKNGVSIATVIKLKEIYKVEDILTFLEKNPQKIMPGIFSTSKVERAVARKEQWKIYRSDEYKKTAFKKGEYIPSYIKEMFKGSVDKELVGVSGNKYNPSVYFICKKCNKEQCIKYDILKARSGHNCEANLSSGEFIVKEYLGQRDISFTTQRETLTCINPITQCIMPYDFELTELNILIEVQGDQHYKYVEYFHGCIENFEYQQWKDEIKKENAEKHGYQLIYISYEDFSDDKYKTIINDLVFEKMTVHS